MVKRKDALRALLSGDAKAGDHTAKDGDIPALPGTEADGASGAGPAMPGAAQNPSPAPSPAPARDHARSGAINAMRASWGELQKQADAARQLREEAMSGGHVILVDPQMILPSPVVDRLSRAGELDPGFAGLKASIAADGQSVPVLLRPHCDPAKAEEGLFETAYGHRRVRAARDLGLKVRAIIRPLSDDELVLAQGRENAERRDLSFIERAFFAKGLEARGFSRETMQSALGIDKSELTRLLQVAERIPHAIARAVGPAPKAGRPRWGEIGETLADMPGKEHALEFVHSGEFQSLADSDERFAALYKHMQRGAKGRKPAGEKTVKSEDGAVLALVKTGPRARPSLAFQTGDGAAFSDFVAARLPDLYRAFKAQEAEAESDPPA
ncbi:plasmid partitioning protein RepB [Jiella mangrovi]|uniref:Plasmid partitioning protein RepB n=1 Tax=Jiella mangrovi TaxID=2821407 RepID=A0ABS4BLU8_9HYPH|nr:plasmid partitioning protein RepB [Jiella mangrovi]MBP0617681.1 plasmid partitioning protein RepB [Jiella mangrovi]